MVDDSSGYVIRGGADGRERLRVLSRIVRPTTLLLPGRTGIAPEAMDKRPSKVQHEPQIEDAMARPVRAGP